MADLYLAEQSKPTTPASGNGVIWPCSTASLPFYTDDAGRHWGRSHNASVAAQGAGFSSDTYVTNSDILIPSFGFQTKTVFRWTINAEKTAAGTAQPVYSLRIGSARTTADTARLQITGPAQTAAVDDGIMTIMATVRTVSASGVIAGVSYWIHSAAVTGFCDNDAGVIDAVSAGFDNSALGGNYIGLSINGGASASWTLNQCLAEAVW